MSLDLDAITKRHADKVSAKDGLTSSVVQGPALGKLQLYAVVAAASADDVPALVGRVRDLEAAVTAVLALCQAADAVTGYQRNSGTCRAWTLDPARVEGILRDFRKVPE